LGFGGGLCHRTLAGGRSPGDVTGGGADLFWQSLLAPLVAAASVGILVTLAVTGRVTVPAAVISVSLTTATAWGGAWLFSLALHCSTSVDG